MKVYTSHQKNRKKWEERRRQNKKKKIEERYEDRANRGFFWSLVIASLQAVNPTDFMVNP